VPAETHERADPPLTRGASDPSGDKRLRKLGDR
jgi:hypothetical protein